MEKKKLLEYRKKYHAFRHHAWAGSVLLAVLLAIRIFFETANIKINDYIMLFVGVILVIYTLIAVFFTYKYSSGLKVNSEEKIVHVHPSSDEIKKEKIRADLEKERLKLEKKKAKAEAKKAKKSKK